MTSLRIVSLLPSTTEMVCLLGLREHLVGISHECDFPHTVRGLPVLTAPKIDPTGRSADIDRQVREVVASGLSVYRIDQDRLRDLRPDLILTQDACAVCAVSFDEVRTAARELVGNQVEIVSLSPFRLEDVLQDILRVARAAGVAGRGTEVVSMLRERLEELRVRTAHTPRPRVLALEWMDPPMPGGHWTPELIRLAGGEPILGREGQPTGRIEWEHIVEAEPEVLLVVPCGFKVPQSVREMGDLLARVARTPAARNRRVYVVDGNAYFNRPGPRLVESAEVAAVAIHPRLFASRYSFSDEQLLAWRGAIPSIG